MRLLAARGDSQLRKPISCDNGPRGGRLHYERLLVHQFHVVSNPAVSPARSAGDTFAGIRPADVGVFMAVQLAAVVIRAAPCTFGTGCRSIDGAKEKVLNGGIIARSRSRA